MNSYILKRLRPIRLAWAAGFGAWEGSFWTSQTSNLDPKTTQHGSKKQLPMLQILLPRTGGWGGASLIRHPAP